MEPVTGVDNRKFHILAIGLIVLAIGVAYANTYTATFHFDDQQNIIDNPRIKYLSNIPSFFWNTEGPTGTRPLLLASFAVNYFLGGLNVVGYHVVNNLLHALNGILLYFFILVTLNLPSLAKRFSAPAKEIALFGALLFVVHPIQTQAVTYIVSRSMPMATFFFLSGLLVYHRAVSTGSRAYYALLVFICFLGMASREDYITFPFVLFLYDALLMSSFREAVKRWWVYALLSWTVAYRLWLTFTYEGAEEATGFGVKMLTPMEYLMTQFNVIWTYVRLLFLPINQNVDYDYPVAKSILEFPTILSFTGHLLVLAFAVFMYRRSRLVTFCILWWYGTLSVSSSFIPIIDVIFEHRVYLPSVGFFFLFMIGYEYVWDFARRKSRRKKSEGDEVPRHHSGL